MPITADRSKVGKISEVKSFVSANYIISQIEPTYEHLFSPVFPLEWYLVPENNDLFFVVTDTAICNFANDIIILSADSCLHKVLERLKTEVLVLSKSFPESFMKLNEEKCQSANFWDDPK